MKKLLFVLAFTFIGQQALSQMYMVILSYSTPSHPAGCNNLPGQTPNYGLVLTKIDPNGNVTYSCISSNVFINSDAAQAIQLNQELNNIISQGYKLTYTAPLYKTNYNNDGQQAAGGGFSGNISLSTSAHSVSLAPAVWYFAVP